MAASIVENASFVKIETVGKCSILLKVKEDEIFNHPSTICRPYGASRYTLSISRIKI